MFFRSSILSFLLGLVGADLKYFSPLLGGEESDDDVRCQSEVVSGEAGPEACDTFFLKGLSDTVTDAAVGHFTVGARFLLLHFCLDIIKWKCTHDDHDGSDHGTGYLDLRCGGSWHRCGDDILAKVVGDELESVGGHGSGYRRHSALPQRGYSLLCNDTFECITHMFVITTLFGWQETVGLHSNQD